MSLTVHIMLEMDCVMMEPTTKAVTLMVVTVVKMITTIGMCFVMIATVLKNEKLMVVALHQTQIL